MSLALTQDSAAIEDLNLTQLTASDTVTGAIVVTPPAIPERVYVYGSPYKFVYTATDDAGNTQECLRKVGLAISLVYDRRD